MDAKYIARSLALTRPALDVLEAAQVALTERFHFKPSLSEVVVYLAVEFNARVKSEKEAGHEGAKSDK